jgi:hypothetical protein
MATLTHKTCDQCNVEQAVLEFYRRPGGIYYATCRSCYNKDEQRHSKVLKARLKCLYGLTIEDYQTLLEKAGSRCEICGKPHKDFLEGFNDKSSRLHIDHCHTTGKIRGLLCSKCNKALGLFKEDLSLLVAAKDYLLRTGINA